MNPRYPVYIVSKGRWKDGQRRTSRALHEMHVPHFLVVEEQEQDAYSAVADATATVLTLDGSYKRDYETCDDLGDAKSYGPGPARNFAWDHAIASGASWHWVIDDNICRFYRLNLNAKIQVIDGTFFLMQEDFIDRYINVAMAGPNYEHFVPRKTKKPPITFNTRIYSCNLIRNDLPYRWRGRYNEDTDLSLRMLKDGWCTVLFNAFLQNKAATQTLKGGNTQEFYAKEGTLPKSQMLVNLHPDIARLVWRFGRWHHYVDYSGYKYNRLRRKPGLEIPDAPNEYGMVLQEQIDGEWVTPAVLHGR